MTTTRCSITRSAERRRALLCLTVTSLLPTLAFAQASSERLLVEVWKSPTCGCCKDWIRHLEANGFRVRTFDDGNTDVRERLGIPLRYGSCHTARVAGYALEGHVPVREIRRLLQEKPAAVGLAVPAMPIGSPGMDGPEYGGQKDPYDVLLVARDGSGTVYHSYR